MLPVHTSHDLFSIFVLVHIKDNWGNIIVTIYGIQEFGLLRFWPDNVWKPGIALKFGRHEEVMADIPR